jgi:formylglycine-generating enzyme required for sulfatase activity
MALVLLSLCLLTANFSFAQAANDEFIRKEKITPPNTKFLRPGYYMDVSEVTNISWLEFLHYVARDSSRDYYNSMLPDTSVWELNKQLYSLIIWRDIDSTLSSYYSADHYFRYPGYRYSPVVGISYLQAVEYCKWRSEAVNMKVKQELDKAGKNYQVSHRYFLPELSDLELAAKGNYEETHLRGKSKRLVKKIADHYSNPELFPGAVAQSVGKTKAGKKIFLPEVNLISYVYSNRNDSGYCNMIGNVSEMTSREGISFGGAWIHSVDEIKNARMIFPYDRPQYWLGFRCACTVEIK